LICHRSYRETFVKEPREACTDIEHLKDHLGSFHGQNYQWEDFERQLLTKWSRANIIRAADGTRTTWFDYKHLHPGLRLHIFYHEYLRERKKTYEFFFAKKERYYPNGDIYDRKDVFRGQMTSLMLLADEARIPYDAFFKHAFRHIMQESGFSYAWKREGKFAKLEMPPATLMFRGETVMAVQQAFDKANQVKLYLPKHSSYLTKNWRGTPYQIEFAKWACSEAKRRGGNFPYALRALVDWGYLHEREILRRFGPDTVKRVRAIVA
jgi:hypothetical protein